MEQRPNILFLMTDQQRHDALGCANPVVQTPVLDRLAREGVRYTQAVCQAPMCVPSRNSLMLGLYPFQTGVRHNAQMCPDDAGLVAPTLAERLRRAGYQTAGIGKTHWYTGDAPELCRPTTRGFEFCAEARARNPARVAPETICMAEDRPEDYRLLQDERDRFKGSGGGENVAGYLGITSAFDGSRHREAWLTDQAIGFLRQRRDATRPFFLYLSFDAPHAGFNVPPEYERLYRLADIPPVPWSTPPAPQHCKRWRHADEWAQTTDEQRRLSRLRYYALCSYVDAQFARVLKTLEETGELERTAIVFCSDHGESLGERHLYSKYSLYEGSVRVPLLLSGAAVAPALRGTTDARAAELVDIVPTVLNIAGGTPGDATLPGEDLRGTPRRSGSYAEYHGWGNEGLQTAPALMWRTPRHKLILYTPATLAAARTAPTRAELYDVLNDPEELNNLADRPEYAGLRAELTQSLLMHIADAGARFPQRVNRTRLAQ